MLLRSVSSPVLLIGALLVASAHVVARDVVSPSLRERMAVAADDELIEAYVVLADVLPADTLTSFTRGLSPRERRRVVAQQLREHAQGSQSTLRTVLDAEISAGRARLDDILWMGNAILFAARPVAIDRLAAVPGVDRIRPVVQLDPAQYQDAPSSTPPPGVGTYPFYDGFETGTLEAHWTVATTGAGYVSVSSAEDPIGGFHALMAANVDLTDSVASLTVQLDLTGQTDVGLRFEQKEFSDEAHPEDGVFVSDDGINWFQVIDLTDGPATYQTRTLTLDDVIGGLGLSFNATFHVRFQWRDNFDIPGDGFAFDEIRIAPGVGKPLPEPHVQALQAPLLWGMGVDGTGVLIGSIDSGAWLTHPDLADRIWINPGEIPDNLVDDDLNGFIDDMNGWDFQNDDNDPTSTDPHGSLSAGLMAGDGTNGRVTGMAPGAQVVVCSVATEAEYWLAQQYLLDVGVDVVSSSYSYKWPDTPDYHMHRQLCDMERAAGIIHANSTGNTGNQLGTHPIPFNMPAPANVPSPFAHPDLAAGGRSSVMACSGIELPGDTHYTPSGRGPAAWEDVTLYDGSYPFVQDPAYWDYPYGGFGGGQSGLVKPDVVAYTNEVMSTTVGSSYAPFSGTSAAAPQLGGAMALMLQQQPEALPRHVAAALELTAVDLGAPGKDELYGSGKIQVWRAARRLLTLCRTSPEEPAIGTSFDLELFGPPSTNIYGFLGVLLDASAGDFNLAWPFVSLPPLPLDGNGELTVPIAVPNDPLLVGITLWFQFGMPLQDPAWGPGPWLSVPDGVTFAP